jgi:hypothetical protein
METGRNCFRPIQSLRICVERQIGWNEMGPNKMVTFAMSLSPENGPMGAFAALIQETWVVTATIACTELQLAYFS